MWIRLIIQPLVSLIIGLRAGISDARDGQPPFGWSVMTKHNQSHAQLKQARNSVARVFIVSLILDLIYQIWVLRWIYPLQAVFVASVLALLPYLLVRGPTNRLITWWHSRHGKRTPASPKSSPNLAVRK
jgi:hypothetical protein